MPTTSYPIIIRTLDDVILFVQEITRLRQIEDIPDYVNLPQRFVRGRTTDRLPSSPSDVDATDNEGDIFTDGDNGFEYTLILVSGVATWDRRTLDFAW